MLMVFEVGVRHREGVLPQKLWSAKVLKRALWLLSEISSAFRFSFASLLATPPS